MNLGKWLRPIIRIFSTSLDIIRTPVKNGKVLLVCDKSNQSKIDEVKSRIEFIVSYIDEPILIETSERASLFDLFRFSVVCSSDSSAVPQFFYKLFKWVVDLDYEINPADGWYLHRVGMALRKQAQRDATMSGKKNFAKHIRNLKNTGKRHAYLFGTGKSLALAIDRSFSDGFVIVCNTIVKDEQLWRHLKPDVFCAGDAIYHFGDNDHARAFRADALLRLKESNGSTIFVYPADFDLIVRSEFQEIAPTLVPIKVGVHEDFKANLSTRFWLPNLGNVLNQLLIPMGMTLSKDLRLWGFDGRAPEDSGFWNNSSSHAYPELVQSIREAHPAFFSFLTPKGNESQYVESVHGDALEKRLLAAELRGFRFSMLHQSWTETLQKRFRGEFHQIESCQI